MKGVYFGIAMGKGATTPAPDSRSSTLAVSNVSDGNDPTLTSGDNLVFLNGAFSASIAEPTLIGNIVLTLPVATGTFALTSDIENIYDNDGTIPALTSRVVTLGGSTSATKLIVQDSTNTYTHFAVNGKGSIFANPSHGANNTGIGGNVFDAPTTGYQNNSFGDNSSGKLTSGFMNNVFGYSALPNCTTGDQNIAVGHNTLASVTLANRNLAIGYLAGAGLTTGGYNTILGTAGTFGSAITNNVVIADGSTNYALWKDASNFIGFGYDPHADTLGAKVDILAQGALTTDLALRVQNSAKTRDIFTVQGDGSVYAGDGSNTWYGKNGGSPATITGYQNSLFGANAGTAQTTGHSCTAIGYQALTSATSAYLNTAIGHKAMSGTVSSSVFNNVAVGTSALSSLTGGNNNVVIGHNAGKLYGSGGGTSLTNGSTSVLIGKDSRTNGNNETNQIVIGNAAIGNGTNTATIGDTNVANLYVGTTLNLYQETTSVSSSTFAAGTSGIANDSATFGGYKLSQIVSALKLQGLLQ